MPHAAVTRHLSKMLLGPLGDTLTAGAVSTRCLVDDEAQVIEDPTGREVVRRVRVATIRTGSITTPAIGSSVTINALAYEVRRVLPMEDGLLTRLVITRADAG